MKLIVAAWLLADRSLFRDMGSGFREKQTRFDGTDIILWILMGIGFIVCVGLVSRLVARSDDHQLFNSPRRLFRALCRAHRLDRSARRLLTEIARAYQIEQPARLFLEPSCFREPSGARPLPPALAGKQAAIAALAVKLFPAAILAPAPIGAEQPGPSA